MMLMAQMNRRHNELETYHHWLADRHPVMDCHHFPVQIDLLVLCGMIYHLLVFLFSLIVFSAVIAATEWVLRQYGMIGGLIEIVVLVLIVLAARELLQ
jgi:hypothetical protein